MSEITKNSTWIVLIQKVPHGPFTELEVKTLLDNKIIRPNDIAYLIPEPPETHSQWKFLWQFPVFDRRLNVKQSENLSKTVEVGLGNKPEERRAEPPKEEVTKKLQESLPADLSQISVEELMYKAKSINPAVPKELTQEAQRDLIDKEFSDSAMTPASSGSSRWMGASLGLLALTGAIWFFSGPPKPKTVTEAPKQIKSEESREVATTKSAPQGSPLDFGVTPRPATAAKKTNDSHSNSAPVARDPEPIRERGEIPAPTDREGGDGSEIVAEDDGVPDELLPPNHPALRNKARGKKKKRVLTAEPPEEVNEPPAEEAAVPPEGAEEEALD